MYTEIEIELVTFYAQDIVTASGFSGVTHEFGDPNNFTENE
jgi:hypothetical protein